MVLIAVIIIAALGGVVIYIFWTRDTQPMDTIKIGVCADIDNLMGKSIYQEAVLAVEQINVEGGV